MPERSARTEHLQDGGISAVERALLPNLLCIGAAKAGTTTFAEIIAAHPAIFMPVQKEPNCLMYDNIENRLDEYLPKYRQSGRALYRCDFSVGYLNSAKAAYSAQRLLPDPRIIVILRNPVDQVISHFWHLRRQNFHKGEVISPAPDLFAALERFPDLLREPAKYGKHLGLWMSLFPRERFFIFTFEELREQLPMVLERLWRFLEVEPMSMGAVEREVPAHRAGVSPRAGLLGRMYPHLYVNLAYGPYRLIKHKLGVTTADYIKETLRVRQLLEAVFFRPGYPKPSAAERCRLRTMFSDDLRLLAELNVVDVSRWREQP